MTNTSLAISPGDPTSKGALQDLASFLVDCPGNVRKAICTAYGLTLDYSDEIPILAYNGQVVGNGQIVRDGVTVNFQIESKNAGVRIQELMAALRSRGGKSYGSVLQFHSSRSGKECGDFSYSYLIGLLREIETLGTHLFEVYASRETITSYGRPVGRVVPLPFVRNQLMGKFGVYECEQLNNGQLKRFATVFLATATAICRDLEESGAKALLKGFSIDSAERTIKACLNRYATDRFSYPLLLSLARPPFPYGMRPLLEQCLMYWRAKGSVSGSVKGAATQFSGHAIYISRMFEDYAGIVLQSGLNSTFERVPSAEYFYAELPGFPRRSLEPDHLMVSEQERVLIVGEVKYSNHLLPRENVAQLIAYLNYHYSSWVNYRRVGLLIYPGETMEISRIDDFGEEIWVCQLPSSLDRCIERMSSWYSQLIELTQD